MRYLHWVKTREVEQPEPEPIPQPEPEPEPEETQQPEWDALTDASGHIWDEERYQTDSEGNPRYSPLGNFILRNGQEHA